MFDNDTQRHVNKGTQQIAVRRLGLSTGLDLSTGIGLSTVIGLSAGLGLSRGLGLATVIGLSTGLDLKWISCHGKITRSHAFTKEVNHASARSPYFNKNFHCKNCLRVFSTMTGKSALSIGLCVRTGSGLSTVTGTSKNLTFSK